MSQISLSAYLSKPDESLGQLQRDEKGYYLVNLGVLNGFNERGEFYRVRDINALLKGDSVFSKRLEGGYLTGEANHPDKTSNMSDQDYYYRSLQIRVENTSHHIRAIELKEIPGEKSIPGAGPTVRVMGWIAPSGTHGEALRSFLDNPEQNAAFSIRCVTSKPIQENGYIVKDILEMITWDWVDIPGIKKANKWSSIAKENMFNDIDIDLDSIEMDNKFKLLSKENSDIIVSHEAIKKSLNRHNNILNNNDVLFNW